MKQKKIFILAAAALAFAACSSDESPTAPEEQQTGAAYTQGEVPVAFDAYVNRGTSRAGVSGEVTSAALLSTSDPIGTAGFGVFAYYTDNKPYSETSIPNFMYNQQVNWESANTWKYSPVKYWPNEFGSAATSDGEDKLTFFAYAPYVDDIDPKTGRLKDGVGIDKTTGIIGMTSNTTTGDPFVKYAVAFDPAKRVDLCWGVAKTSFNNTVQGATANNIAINNTYVDVVKPMIDAKIGFQFYHALAALNVQIDADVDIAPNSATHTDAKVDENTRIWVRSVTFEGFTDKGALNLHTDGTIPGWFEFSNTNSTISGTAITVYDGRRDGKEGVAAASNEKNVINTILTQGSPYSEWNPSDGLKPTDDTHYKGVTNTAVNLFGGGIGDPIYVIPTDQKLNITIVYDVETYDGKVAGYLADGKTKGSVVENKITKEAIFPAAMAAGKKYVVQLHLGMTSVKFDADVKDWETGSGSNTDLPYNSH